MLSPKSLGVAHDQGKASGGSDMYKITTCPVCSTEDAEYRNIDEVGKRS